MWSLMRYKSIITTTLNKDFCKCDDKMVFNTFFITNFNQSHNLCLNYKLICLFFLYHLLFFLLFLIIIIKYTISVLSFYYKAELTPSLISTYSKTFIKFFCYIKFFYIYFHFIIFIK